MPERTDDGSGAASDAGGRSTRRRRLLSTAAGAVALGGLGWAAFTVVTDGGEPPAVERLRFDLADVRTVALEPNSATLSYGLTVENPTDRRVPVLSGRLTEYVERGRNGSSIDETGISLGPLAPGEVASIEGRFVVEADSHGAAAIAAVREESGRVAVGGYVEANGERERFEVSEPL